MNINATLFVQIAVFVALWWFTAKFVWPPIVKSLDERSKRIADGLAAAEKARDGAAEVRSGAERQAGQLLEEARAQASQIVAAAKKAAEEEASLAAQRAKEQLRDQVAQLAVAGAERILRREIDGNRHAELLGNLKNELR